MKLYHGTSAKAALLARDQGLKTRKTLRSKGNWQGTIPSNPNLIYLTVAYAPYFAMSSSGDGEEWGIVEVDTDLLDLEDMLPDEDFLEQASRTQTLPAEWGLKGASMEKRTRFFRDHIESFSHLWQASLDGLGNAAHRGKIPKSAITRVTTFDPSQNPSMAMMASDPTISTLNFRILGEKYRTLTRWFAGYEIDPLQLVGFGVPPEALPEEMRVDLERRAERIRVSGHQGITQVGA